MDPLIAAQSTQFDNLKRRNLVLLVIAGIMYLITAIVCYLSELLLAIYIISLFYSVSNAAFLVSPQARAPILKFKIFTVFIPAAVVDLLAIIELIRTLVNSPYFFQGGFYAFKWWICIILFLTVIFF